MAATRGNGNVNLDKLLKEKESVQRYRSFYLELTVL